MTPSDQIPEGGERTRLCQNCEYWADPLQLRNRQLMAKDFGECRARSPVGMSFTATTNEDRNVVAVLYPFPPTAPTDWCGDFSHKDDEGMPF